jgi:membrane protease YdiL (CAAX protease family)
VTIVEATNLPELSQADVSSAPPPALRPLSIIAILLISLGWSAVGSAVGLLRDGKGRLIGFEIPVSNVELLSLLVFELVVGLSIVGYLRWRGWNIGHLTRPFVGRDLLRGMRLWLGMILCVWAVMIAVVSVAPSIVGPLQASRVVGHVSWPVLFAVSLVNPVFEELLLLGFISAGFSGAGFWRIGVLSVALRVIVHTYQGAYAMLSIAPIGIIFAVYYLRTRRLGPVIVAHAIQDALGLSVLAWGGGVG